MAVFQDPTVTVRNYLVKHLQHPIFLDEPDSDSYDYREACVLVKDLGSRVLFNEVFLEAFVQLDIRATSREDAERLSGEVFSLMREWSSYDSSVVPQDDRDFPQWNPEADRRIPAYTFTYRAWLRPSTQNKI